MQTIAATVTIHFMTYTYYYSQCVENNKDSFVSTQSELSLCIHSSLGTGIALLYLCYITVTSCQPTLHNEIKVASEHNKFI